MKTSRSRSFRRASKFSRRKKLLLAAPLLTGAIAAPAQASIVFTPVNGGAGQSVSNTDPFAVYFSPSAQQVQTTYFVGAQFLLQFFHGSASRPYIGVNPDLYFAVASCFPYGYKLSAGAGINQSLLDFYAAPTFLHDNGNGYWSPGDRGYLGLGLVVSSQKYYGWADVSYNTGSLSLTLYGFAYETAANTTILAGAVPEPAETAAIGALVAGSAAALAARRRRKIAKAA